MISRRVIRIKIMQSLYAFHCSTDKSINVAEKGLFHSIDKTYDLYHMILDMLVEIQKVASTRIEQNKHKNIPTEEDLNPNHKFVNNEILVKLSENKSLNKYVELHKIAWIDSSEFFRRLFKELMASEMYLKYMKNTEKSIHEDREILEYFLVAIVAESEELNSLLEEKSIYWNDDLEFVISMVIKTLNKFKLSTTEDRSLLPKYKDEDDYDFTKKLFRKAVLETKDHREIINKHLRNWDLERVAFIDVLIMEMAICEFIYFPSVPTKVTLNEYIDLANYYSTQKSRTFINGILDKILKSLKDDGKCLKSGRGLIGENA